jgi:acyl carrier protein
MSDADRIRAFLIDELHWRGPPSELTEDLPLIESRVVDSMGLLRLVAWLEETFMVEISDAEVVPVNFGTIRGIEDLVARKSPAT